MRSFVIGDIHGAHLALKQCLERSGFNYEKDRLICLGDVCDGWPEVRQCFDELLKIKDLVYILGNHDDWALEWYDRATMYRGTPGDIPEHLWTSQGGRATLESYGGTTSDEYYPIWKDMDKSHLELLKSAVLYYTEKNFLFTHGGIRELWPLEETHRDVFLWDRDMWTRAVIVHPCNPDFKIHQYDRIFIGHTSVQYNHRKLAQKKGIRIADDSDEATKPMLCCNVWNLDTGAGWDGKLTIMNIDTEEYWQSDLVRTLYSNVKGRK